MFVAISRVIVCCLQRVKQINSVYLMAAPLQFSQSFPLVSRQKRKSDKNEFSGQGRGRHRLQLTRKRKKTATKSSAFLIEFSWNWTIIAFTTPCKANSNFVNLFVAIGIEIEFSGGIAVTWIPTEHFNVPHSSYLIVVAPLKKCLMTRRWSISVFCLLLSILWLWRRKNFTFPV